MNQEPWLVMGNFNETLTTKEAVGGGARDMGKMRRFREATSNCGLRDLSFTCPSFTYSKRRRHPNEAKARLDRIFANSEWSNLFSEAEVKHSVAVTSDHIPLFLDTNGRYLKRRRRHFKYEVIWQGDGSFQETLRDFWEKAKSSTSSFSEMSKGCAELLNHWNKTSFGNVQRRIKEWKQKLAELKE